MAYGESEFITWECGDCKRSGLSNTQMVCMQCNQPMKKVVWVRKEAAQRNTQPPTLAPCSCGGERQLLIRCARCRSVDEYKG